MAKRGSRSGGGGGGGGGSGGGLSKLSMHDLRAELSRRQKAVGGLIRRRDRLAERVRAIDAQIAGLGGPNVGRGELGGRKRPKNDMPLVDALAKLLKGRTLSVTEASRAVQEEIGYATTSSSFRTIVNQTLINSGQFKRVGRGQYTVK